MDREIRTELLFAVPLLGGFMLVICGPITFAWQLYTWLRSGVWIGISLAMGMKYVGVDLTSIYNPSDWYGLAKSLQWLLGIPLAIAFPIIGFLTIIVFLKMREDVS